MAHIRLNTHPSQGGVQAPPVVWGARDPAVAIIERVQSDEPQVSKPGLNQRRLL